MWELWVWVVLCIIILPCVKVFFTSATHNAENWQEIVGDVFEILIAQKYHMFVLDKVKVSNTLKTVI